MLPAVADLISRSDKVVVADQVNAFGRMVVMMTQSSASRLAYLGDKVSAEQGAELRAISRELRSYGAARREIMPGVEHRSHKGLNNRAENSHQPVRRREKIMKRYKSARHLQRYVSIHDPVANLFHIPDTTFHLPIIANCEQQPWKHGTRSHTFMQPDPKA